MNDKELRERIAEWLEEMAIDHKPGSTQGRQASARFYIKDTAKMLAQLFLEELAKREKAARIDEVGRAAPHQMARYFEVPQSKLNQSWMLEYAKQRINELEGKR